MGEERKKPLYGKIIIRGEIYCKTGLHIGGPGGQYEIGGLDAPVVRDPITDEPYIPGSSLKGKLRSLLERKLCREKPGFSFNRQGGTETNPVYRHECTDPDCPVCRLFGSTKGKEEGHNLPARLIVRDARLTEESRRKLEEIETGLRFTEWKFENALDRISSAANPRQIERVPAGARFQFELIYNVETFQEPGRRLPSRNEIEAQAKQDLQNLVTALRLLEDDFLGGHGSRGYGRVEFRNLKLEAKRVEWYQEPKNEHIQRSTPGTLDALAKELPKSISFILGGGKGEP